MKTGLFIVIVAALALVLGTAAFYFAEKYHQPTPTASASPSVVATAQYKEYGNGVYYFEATGDTYMQMLALFYEQNPGLRCAMQGHTADGYGVPTGFILHCYDPAVPAQEVTVP